MEVSGIEIETPGIARLDSTVLHFETECEWLRMWNWVAAAEHLSTVWPVAAEYFALTLTSVEVAFEELIGKPLAFAAVG